MMSIIQTPVLNKTLDTKISKIVLILLEITINLQKLKLLINVNN